VAKPRNDRNNAVTKFCLAMEEHRRTEAGRVRTAKEFVTQFFPWDASGAKDLLFHHVPNDVRGPVLSGWGIRGAKAALRDDDERVKNVVHDAFTAGDIDDAIFEEGATAQILIDWIPLADWWNFWRHGKLTGVAIQKALATARELALIDDRWFLLNVQGRGGKLKGTDVLCDTLSKDQIVAWIRKIHETGDGSPAGIIAAIGWETVLAKTAQDALLFALDQFARKAALAEDKPEPNKSLAPLNGPTTPPTQSHSVPAKEEKVEAKPAERDKRDSGLPVAIPDFPVVDGDHADDPPSIPSVEERSMWAGGGNTAQSESPKLAEARAAMMAMLDKDAAGGKPREAWDDSEVPAKPSSLEWPEPEPVKAGAAPPDSLVPVDDDDDEDTQTGQGKKAPVPAPPPPKRPPPPPTAKR
jgi:hypothetical protein